MKAVKILGIALIIILVIGMLASENEPTWNANLKVEKTGGLAGKSFKITNNDEVDFSSIRIEINGIYTGQIGSILKGETGYKSYNELGDETGNPMPQNIIINKGILYIESVKGTAAISFTFN